MADHMLATEFHKAFINAYTKMDFYAYVTTVLQVMPNKDDVWQLEKFEIFKNAGRALSRISSEYVERIIDFDLT